MSKQIPLLIIYIAFLCPFARLRAQMPISPLDDENRSHWTEEDSVEKVDVPVGSYVWTVDRRFGMVRPALPDTLPHAFQNTAFTDGLRGHYNFTGNLGAPRQSRLFTEWQDGMFGSQFIFQRPYDFFITQPDELLFYNTKSPLTNITYHECGNKQNGEDRIRAVYAVNVNRRLGVGFKLDYLYGRGYYANQSTAHFDGTLFGSYIGERYQLHAMYYANHLKNAENGGVEDDAYVTNPESFPTKYSPADMPVNLQKTWNKLNVNTFFLTHRYSFGFTRWRGPDGNVVRRNSGAAGRLMGRIGIRPDSLRHDSAQAAEDTLKLVSEFVPVAGIIHTMRLDHNNRRFLSNFRSNADNRTYFDRYYLPGDSANDFTKNVRVENLLALELREGFNKWVKSGMRLYVRHEVESFTLPDERKNVMTFHENYLSLGAQLMKEQGRLFHYDLLGEIRTTGSDWGEFNVEGNADLNFPLLRDTLKLRIDGYVRNEQPSFYFRHFHARNAWWDNSLDRVFRTRVGGLLSWNKTQLAVHLETMQNYTCFAEGLTSATDPETGTRQFFHSVGVRQSSKNVQLLSATLRQDFRWGILNWENEFTYQATSDKDICPLPAFTGYTNLYLLFRIAKVLRTEFGADLRYFTEYYAPTYSPVIGQYCLQDPAERVKVGNYPVVDVYVNFHLKHTRFYFMASHVNRSSGGRPFLVPHYPLNEMVIRMGLSWNFFN